MNFLKREEKLLSNKSVMHSCQNLDSSMTLLINSKQSLFEKRETFVEHHHQESVMYKRF